MSNTDHLENGLLTERITAADVREIQGILEEDIKKLSPDQKRKIELRALRFQMEDYLHQNNPTLVSVGEFLRKYLKSLEIKQNRFAEYVGMKPSNLSKLLNGERPINSEMALILGKLFDHDALLWLEIQSKNELIQLSRQKAITEKISLDDLLSASL